MANVVEKVINIALAEVGYLEKKSNSNLYDKTANAGSNNYTKYGKEMHDIYPSVMDFPAAWCDCFVDWCFYKAYGTANAKGLLGGNFNDYTPSSAQLYKNKNAWYTSNPKVGDQIFFTNGTRIYHTGLVYKVDSTYVYTVEGNTSGASGVVENGGGVCKKKYKLNYNKIAGYGRPKYDKGKQLEATQTPINNTTATTTSTSNKASNTTTATYTKTQFIKDVQKAIGAKVDGVAGNETLSKTITVSKTKNNKHSVVKPIQKYLNALGYNCGTADGIAGTLFHNAVIKFQKNNGCTADGEITAKAKTWKKLLGL